MSKPYCEVKLGDSYYNKGFFNVGVSASHYMPKEDKCEITFHLPLYGTLNGRMDRAANKQSTNAPRVFGGVRLRDWFHRHFELNDVVRVYFDTPTDLRIEVPS